MEKLTHQYLEKLKQSHPAVRLLNADNAPFVISFLYRVFIQPNQRSISYSDLHSKLNDYLYLLQEIYGENKYPRNAKEYIEDWCSPQKEFLRQYYTSQIDEPELDLTPAVEKAIEWLLSLEQKQFIGAESRLLTLFQLLRDLVALTETDPEERIRNLETQKTNIEHEIEKIRSGEFNAGDARLVKEKFFQVDETARKLLSDFRQVEHNFRVLDREARERIASSDEQKGKLLDIIFQEQDVIQESDQGKSFKAFWEFLMSPTSQDELKKMIATTLDLQEIKQLNYSSLLPHIDIDLLTAGEKVYKSSALLAEQLRKYLETQAFLENRRILEIIKNIEKLAINIKSTSPKAKAFVMVDGLTPEIDLIMSRTLFTPPKNPMINSSGLKIGEADITLDLLYQQSYVDENQLLSNIHKALQIQSQISLKELITMFPITKGLEEVITYLHLATKDSRAYIDNERDEDIMLPNKMIKMPMVIFSRRNV